MSHACPLETRAQWQRSEGMVVFDQEFRRFFPAVLGSATDTAIEWRLLSYETWHQPPSQQLESLGIAHSVGALLAEQSHPLANEGTANPSLLPDPELNPAYSRVKKYTHMGLDFGLKDAVESTVHFPLNLLDHAEVTRLTLGLDQPLFRTVTDLANVLRQPWFIENCENAAFTTNGVWRQFSITEAPSAPDALAKYLELEFTTINDQLTFSFASGSLEALRKTLKDRNSTVQRQLRNSDSLGVVPKGDVEVAATGSSSGCPAAHLAPHFTDAPQDTTRLAKLAAYYHTTTDQLTAVRPETTIGFGLDGFADFLDRSEVIRQGMVAAGTLPIDRAAF